MGEDSLRFGIESMIKQKPKLQRKTQFKLRKKVQNRYQAPFAGHSWIDFCNDTGEDPEDDELRMAWVRSFE